MRLIFLVPSLFCEKRLRRLGSLLLLLWSASKGALEPLLPVRVDSSRLHLGLGLGLGGRRRGETAQEIGEHVQNPHDHKGEDEEV